MVRFCGENYTTPNKTAAGGAAWFCTWPSSLDSAPFSGRALVPSGYPGRAHRLRGPSCAPLSGGPWEWRVVWCAAQAVSGQCQGKAKVSFDKNRVSSKTTGGRQRLALRLFSAACTMCAGSPTLPSSSPATPARHSGSCPPSWGRSSIFLQHELTLLPQVLGMLLTPWPVSLKFSPGLCLSEQMLSQETALG